MKKKFSFDKKISGLQFNPFIFAKRMHFLNRIDLLHRSQNSKQKMIRPEFLNIYKLCPYWKNK